MTQGKGAKSIAVIGTGIAGMAAAWLLSQRHEVTVYEKADRPGGHTNTVLVPGKHGSLPVETGFIVYNEAAYPNLTALFRHLDIPTIESDMSFTVSLRGGKLEYSGTNLTGLFSQKINLLRPRFWSMLRNIIHFYRNASSEVDWLDDSTTLGEFLDAKNYSTALRDDHLLPMAGAIWSAAPRELLAYPARSFIRFFVNHQLLNLGHRSPWRTVKGGSRNYVEKLIDPYRDKIRLRSEIASLIRDETSVVLDDRRHGLARYDAVVIATHADQALRLLDHPTHQEERLFGAFRYSRNLAVLHSDARLMPRRPRVWSSWNYIGGADCRDDVASVTYWMNRLQKFENEKPFFLSLNPGLPPKNIIHQEVYEHPIFDCRGLSAQRDLWSLQGHRNTWFCGSYFGSGFHEDGLQSGLAVAEALGGVKRPWRVPAESDRIELGPPASPRNQYECAA